jgi:hypothetical protein
MFAVNSITLPSHSKTRNLMSKKKLSTRVPLVWKRMVAFQLCLLNVRKSTNISQYNFYFKTIKRFNFSVILILHHHKQRLKQFACNVLTHSYDICCSFVYIERLFQDSVPAQ